MTIISRPSISTLNTGPLPGQGLLSRVRRRHLRRRGPLAGAELLPAGKRPADDLDPFLAAAHGQAHDPGRCLQRQPQAQAGHAALRHAEHPVSRASARGGRAARGDRLRDVHPSARRPCRLEHAAGERQVGADLSQRQVRDVANRPRLLGSRGQAARHRGLQGQHLQRFGAAHRRGEEGRVRDGRARHVRLPDAEARARPHAGPDPRRSRFARQAGDLRRRRAAQSRAGAAVEVEQLLLRGPRPRAQEPPHAFGRLRRAGRAADAGALRAAARRLHQETRASASSSTGTTTTSAAAEGRRPIVRRRRRWPPSDSR